MNDTIKLIPKDVTLVSDAKRERMSAEQCAMTINCLVRSDGPRQLTLLHTSGLKGKPGEEWVEASSSWAAGVYRWVFCVRGGLITNCLLCTSPSMKEYSIDIDGDNPFDDVIIEDRKMLTHLLLGEDKKRGVEIVPCWIIAIGGARPYSSHLHYSLEAAEAARDEQEIHWKKYRRAPEEIKDSQLTEKLLAKESQTIAFRAKKKGTTKTKKK